MDIIKYFIYEFINFINLLLFKKFIIRKNLSRLKSNIEYSEWFNDIK
jgi:hypothetical protein